MKLVNPANKRKYHASSWSAPGSRAASPPRRWASWATTSSASASRTRPRRAHRIAAQGGINAAKNYQNDGDSDLAAVLRHGQGRGLPGPRGECLPPGPDQRQHHRPVRGAGRAVRARVRRPAGQPLVRRRPGLADLLRPRARPGSSCCSAPTRRWSGRSRPAPSRCSRGPRCSTSSWSMASPAAS